MSRIGILSVSLILATPLLAAALDAPHDSSGATVNNCSTTCHTSHQAQGGSLSKSNSNSALCQSCHTLAYQPDFGFPWSPDMQGASSHNWSASASNLGATPPDPASADTVISAMGNHLDAGGKLKCSTCHDVHNASAAGGTMHASVANGANVGCYASCGTVTVQLVYPIPAAAKAAGYKIKLSTTTNVYNISHDNGVTWGANRSYAPNSPTTLDDNATQITISGYASGATWNAFYVSYPFLRANAARLCVSCHKDRNQTYVNVEGTGTVWNQSTGSIQPVQLTTTVFSHPVNQKLNANGGGYDRTMILDANGASSQATGDGNPVNDLVLDAAGNVNCLTCHHPHNAPSNSANTHTW
jgi:hypothetical protein